MRRLGIDVDGVLADFTLGFTSLAQDMGFGIPTRPTVLQHAWDYATLGLTRQQHDAVWDELKKGSKFWLSLSLLVNDGDRIALARLADHDVEIHYVTSRPGDEVEESTFNWLVANDLPRGLVHVEHSGSSKINAVLRLGLSSMIDDKPAVLEAIAEEVPEVTLYKRVWGYNRTSPGIPVASIGEMVRHELELHEKLERMWGHDEKAAYHE